MEMGSAETQNTLTNLGVGKLVGEHLYLHSSALKTLLPSWLEKIDEASQIAEVVLERDFNVVKININGSELSLLSYPEFFETAFPTLSRSWRVSLLRKTAVYRNYSESSNPPILHKKELLLMPDEPRTIGFRLLTETAQLIGLFDDPHMIGTRDPWHNLIAERGYELQGHMLLPLANDLGTACTTPIHGTQIQRHLTALTRPNFSAPVQALWRHGLVETTRTFFDYGCGKGDDVRELCNNGIDASGWDPYYAVDGFKRRADTVNIGFVINVIEDIAERVQALRSAYSYTDGVLSVAAMLSSQTQPDGKAYCDGTISTRNTFQKYFSQTQLRDFIEESLDEPAVAVGPGVFFVFRDKELEQRFFLKRYGRKGREKSFKAWVFERLQRENQNVPGIRKQQPKLSNRTVLFDCHSKTLFSLWNRCLELGRTAEKSELDIDLLQAIEHDIGSLKRAIRICLKHFSRVDLDRAALQRSEDLVVFAAMQQFQKRQPYRQLNDVLRNDIKHFYNGYLKLQACARQQLFSLANLDKINRSCLIAAENGVGWFEESRSLQVHTSLISKLPSNLRIFIGCATTLYGDINEFDLVKIHIRSGKVTLMKFDNFLDSALPRMTERVKIKLRDLDLNVFVYGEPYPSPFLYLKSRFINEEIVHFSEQVAFEKKLKQLGFQFDGYGPSADEFITHLRAKRWEVNGFSLIRARQIPSLDDRCGAHFNYRHLIECGATQHSTKILNVPVHPDTYTALYELAVQILDPVIEYFGMIKLTYGFCSASLAREIKSGIAPHLDQHAGHEVNRMFRPICPRLGIACDFLVEDENMKVVANWIAENTPFDRIYFYGEDKPIHVSFSETPSRQIVSLKYTASGRRVPTRVQRV